MLNGMLKNMTRRRLIWTWFGIVGVVIIIAVAMGARLNASNAAVILGLCLAPPAIAFLLWPIHSPTVAEVIHDADQP
jgi:Mn2+/Fe2+ NRAMP family transporter